MKQWQELEQKALQMLENRLSKDDVLIIEWFENTTEYLQIEGPNPNDRF